MIDAEASARCRKPRVWTSAHVYEISKSYVSEAQYRAQRGERNARLDTYSYISHANFSSRMLAAGKLSQHLSGQLGGRSVIF